MEEGHGAAVEEEAEERTVEAMSVARADAGAEHSTALPEEAGLGVQLALTSRLRHVGGAVA